MMIGLTPWRREIGFRDIFPGRDVKMRDPSAHDWPFEGRFTRDWEEAERWRWAYWRRVAPDEAAEAQARANTAAPTGSEAFPAEGPQDEAADVPSLDPEVPPHINVTKLRARLKPDDKRSFVQRWRQGIADKQVRISPITRLVLHTIGTHMNADGGSCYPSIKRIARESGLAPSTVAEHLRIAGKDGWVRKIKRWRDDGGVSSNKYYARFPDWLAPLLQAPGNSDKSGVREAEGGYREAEGGTPGNGVALPSETEGGTPGDGAEQVQVAGTGNRTHKQNPPWVQAVCDTWHQETGGYLQTDKAFKLCAKPVEDLGAERVLARLERYIAWTDASYRSLHGFTEQMGEYAFADPDEDDDAPSPQGGAA